MTAGLSPFLQDEQHFTGLLGAIKHLAASDGRDGDPVLQLFDFFDRQVLKQLQAAQKVILLATCSGYVVMTADPINSRCYAVEALIRRPLFVAAHAQSARIRRRLLYPSLASYHSVAGVRNTVMAILAELPAQADSRCRRWK